MDTTLILFLMALCLMMEAFFSGAEIGVVSADRLKLRHSAAKGHKGAKLALEMLKKPEWLLSTTLVGTNVAIVTNTSLATLLAIQLFGKENSWMAIVVAAPLVWIFGEIVPKSIFQQKADFLTPRVIHILRAASLIFYPILLVFTTLTRLVTRLSGASDKENNHFTLRQELDLMLGMPEIKGDVEPEEREMIRRMFNFSETRVRDIAIPLVDVVAIPHHITCGRARQLASEKGHLRLPVYKERIHQLIGMVDVRSLVNCPPEVPITAHVQEVRFVPPSMSLEKLLTAFQNDGDRFAVVLGEFGSAVGIITLEDIMERIVGRIEDEYDGDQDRSENLVRSTADGELYINARADLITLKESWGIDLPEGPYETLSGFLLEQVGDIPKPRQQITYKNMKFTVERADDKCLQEIRLQLSPA